MKKILSILFFISFVFQIFPQNKDSKIKFIKGNIVDKTKAIKESTGEDSYWLAEKAIQFALDNKEILGNDRELDALVVSAILTITPEYVASADKLSQAEILFNFTKLFNIMDDKTIFNPDFLTKLIVYKDEINKRYDRVKQKIRIAKDRLSLGRKLENWSKRGGKLRRQIFINRQYYYLIAPYTFLFIIFTVVPVIMSLFLSFTYFNLLELPTFIGWDNYMNLFVNDDVWMVAIKNTAILAVITGPLSYIMAFVFAWLINELRPLLRSFMTLVFYAPSISGNVYLVWKLIFSSDMYGYANALLIQTNIIKEPITWLQDADYIVWILIIVQLWMSLGVSFLSFIAGLQSVNKELYEAGAIDGIKNRWQELWHITLPQMKSQLLFGAVMQITSALSIADVSVNLAGFPSVEYAGHTIITHLMDYSSIRMEMGYASAIATILFLIMILANIGVRKILRRVGA